MYRTNISTSQSLIIKKWAIHFFISYRCQLVEKLPDCKEGHECAEIFKLSTEGTVNHTFYPGVHICKENGFVNVLVGHLAINVRVKTRSGQESNGVQEPGKDVYDKESEGSSGSPRLFGSITVLSLQRSLLRLNSPMKTSDWVRITTGLLPKKNATNVRRVGKHVPLSEQHYHTKECFKCKQCGEGVPLPSSLQVHERMDSTLARSPVRVSSVGEPLHTPVLC